MPEILPVEPGNPFQEFSTSLNGTQIVLVFRWNGRDGAWYNDVYAEDAETPLAHGIKVVLGASLWFRVLDERMPAGALIAVDTTGEHAEATLDSLGATVELRFYTPDEVETLAAPV